MARVGVDLDGVVYPFHQEFLKYANWHGYIDDDKLGYTPTTWEFFDDIGITKDEFKYLMKKGVDIIFTGGVPLPGAVLALWSLRANEHEIVLITNRYKRSQTVTEMWLKAYDIPYDELHHVVDKTQIKVDFHIDDKAEHVVAMQQAGVKAYLLDQPWNQADDLPRVDAITQFTNYINSPLQRA